MEYEDDGLSILNLFVETINRGFDFGNPVIRKEFMKSQPDMIKYKDYHKNIAEENDGDSNLDSLLFLRLLLLDVSHYIHNNQEEIKKNYQYRLGALGKISKRLEVITDENLVLLRHEFGTSVVSNLRLMLECYAIAKYLMDCDDVESDRFQDYGIVQECRFNKEDAKEKLVQKNYEKDFYRNKSEFAWISDKSIRNVSDLIKCLGDESINEWYKFYCQYVHASPYSCGKVHQMNQSLLENNNGYIPLNMEILIQQNKLYLTLFIELLSDNFIADKTIGELFKTLLKLS
ncbi:MAG: hypothetical protein J6R67_05885 [Treponema sp.]|nr:hypothetical protein [Treponema sp.]